MSDAGRAREAAGPSGHAYAAWLVDLDGTLYAPGPVRLATAAELALREPRAIPVLRRFRHEHERLRRIPADTGRTPFEEQLARTAAASRLPVSAIRPVVERWMFRRPAKWMRRFRRRWLIAAMTSFRAGGGRIAIVSDYPATAKIDAMTLAAVVEVVVASGDRRSPPRLKPDATGLQMAATALSVPNARCLVIGDRPETDGEAARRAGMAFADVRGLRRRGLVRSGRLPAVP